MPRRRSLIGWLFELDEKQEDRLAVWLLDTFPFLGWILRKLNR